MSKAAQLERLRQSLLDDEVCPALAAGATQLVMGDGNVDADMVIIGEAPGKKEDEQGVPFVGASGTFLDGMLQGAGMQRSDVYITNMVKYRPPNNRDPLVGEKKAFWPYLLTQLEIISPKVVITLGRHSMEYFLPGAKIGEVHGKPHRVQLGDRSYTVIPLYHPAAALYNGSLRATLMDDFMAVPSIVASV